MVNIISVFHIYTVLVYGLSICLWAVMSQIVLLEEMPFYLIHPYFTAEFFFMLSTLIVWTISLVVSLIHSLEQGVPKIKAASENFSTVLLLFITIIAAIFGCIYFFKVVYYPEPHISDLWMDDWLVSPPNLLAVIYCFGVLFSEAGWIILGIAKILKRNWSGPARI